MKVFTLEEITNKHIGKRGTLAREQFELELELARIGDGIRALRKHRNLTQEQLGQLVGVQKAQISKLESNAGNMTLETVVRIISAMKASVTFKFDSL